MELLAGIGPRRAALGQVWRYGTKPRALCTCDKGAGMDTGSSAALEGDAEEQEYTQSYALRHQDDVTDALDLFWKTMVRSAIFPKTVETEGKTESVIQKDDVGTCGSNPRLECVHSRTHPAACHCSTRASFASFTRRCPRPRLMALNFTSC